MIIPQKEINKQYRKLAKDLHPDHNKAEDAHEKFELLVAAYEVCVYNCHVILSRDNYTLQFAGSRSLSIRFWIHSLGIFLRCRIPRPSLILIYPEN